MEDRKIMNLNVKYGMVPGPVATAAVELSDDGYGIAAQETVDGAVAFLVAGLSPCKPDLQSIFVVQGQDGDGRSASAGFSLDPDPVPYEMFVPSISSGIEQGSHALRFRIDPCKVRAFPQIAIDTGQCQIFGIVAAAVLACPNVLDLQSGKG